MGRIGQYILRKLHITDIIDQNNRILELLNAQKSIDIEILKGITFQNSILNSNWLRYKDFSPGGWAADYGLLYTLYRVLDSAKPSSILEFGLGQSSKVIHQYASYYKQEAVTVEHDKSWIDFFSSSKTGEYEVNIMQLELEETKYNNVSTLTYKNCQEALRNKKYDLVLVDAPFGSRHYSRSQIIDIVENNLKESFCIIIDDYERNGEQETAEEVFKLLDKNGAKYVHKVYSASKQHLLICSSDMKFLTSM